MGGFFKFFLKKIRTVALALRTRVAGPEGRKNISLRQSEPQATDIIPHLDLNRDFWTSLEISSRTRSLSRVSDLH
jgi:hypothetical protein